jgi:hypothetical protein
MTDKDIEIYRAYKQDPFLFIKDMWWLTPVKQWEDCVKGENISWQQAEIVQHIYDEVQKTRNFRINMTIKSGHSIGKSTILAMLLLWFMFCYRWKIWLTAPDSVSLYDVLWSEIWTWLLKMPDWVKDLFEKTSDHLYVRDDRDWWFARCKTGKKENPEALAWLHSDSMMLICDEASWVPDQILDTARTNLTADRYIFILIWNPLRNVGYFYESFNDIAWKQFSFSTLDSPFQWDLPEKISKKFWLDSDEYRRRILWDFPREDILDEKWYVQLIMKDDIKYEYHDENLYWTRKILGVDCAWTGKDKSTWVLRDNNKAVIVWYENISDERSIAQRTLTLVQQYWLEGKDIVIDNFGAWANVAMHLALLWIQTSPINVWDRVDPESWQKYKNLRAKLFWNTKKWLESWGLLSYRDYWSELLNIRYKRTLTDEIQIMSKEEMRKAWYGSPDFADALAMTFYIDISRPEKRKVKKGDSFRYNPMTWKVIK